MPVENADKALAVAPKPATLTPIPANEPADVEKSIESLGTRIRPGKSNLEQDFAMTDTVSRYKKEPSLPITAERKTISGKESILMSGPVRSIPIQTQNQQYSLLSKPVASPAPESTLIGEIYLSNEKLPENIFPISAASISEIISDTAGFETIKGQTHEVIALENMPRAIKMAMPEYPTWSQKNGISGEVWIKALLDINGNITDVVVLGSSNPGKGFEESAVKAAKESKFTPAEYGGKRFPIWIIYPVKFVIK